MGTIKHPYADFEKTELWKIIDKALQELTENNDVKVQTDRNYIVGHIAKSLSKSGLVKSESL